MKNDLPRNFHLARGVLMSTLKRLRSEPELLKAHDTVIKDYVEKGFIEEISPPPSGVKGVHFLPHHGVKRNSATTPLRIVFNCSAGHPSLNSCLETGPCLLNDLCQVLLRFRLNEYVALGDISKAYLYNDSVGRRRPKFYMFLVAQKRERRKIRAEYLSIQGCFVWCHM